MYLDDKLIDSAATIGQNYLHAQFPHDIEAYYVAFELLDKNYNTIAFFPMTYNPTAYVERPMDSNKRFLETHGGITVLRRSTFSPRVINMGGWLGRKFRFIFGDLTDFGTNGIVSDRYDIAGYIEGHYIPLKKVGKQYDIYFKNGYGCSKFLEGMFNMTKRYDKDAPYILVMYNGFTGNDYVVEPVFYDFPHTIQNNMIYSYNFQFKAIAPASDILSAKKKDWFNSNILYDKMLHTIVDGPTDAVIGRAFDGANILNRWARRASDNIEAKTKKTINTALNKAKKYGNHIKL